MAAYRRRVIGSVGKIHTFAHIIPSEARDRYGAVRNRFSEEELVERLTVRPQAQAQARVAFSAANK